MNKHRKPKSEAGIIISFLGRTSVKLKKHKRIKTTVEKAIETKIAELFATISSQFLLNERQAHLLLTLEQKLDLIEPMLDEPIQYELLSAQIKDALIDTSQLTGKTISEQTMDQVFKQFCVGK